MEKYLTIMRFEPTTPVDLESRELSKRTHLFKVLKKLSVHYIQLLLKYSLFTLYNLL